MMDFLKANPSVTKDEYMWEWSVPQISLAMNDYTHIEYLSEAQSKALQQTKKQKKYDNPMSFVNDFNIPILK